MPQRITFLGAARTVTGSKHLLELDGKKVLVDCGMFQGPRELRERNWLPLPVAAHELDAMVLTHAHMDHIGMLPRFVKDGFRGPAYATPSTIGLCRISLPDSGRIQEEDARYHARHGTSRHVEPKPLYDEAEAYEALKVLKPVHFWQWQQLPAGAQFRFMPAGHIIGSGFAEVYFENGERILMSGDLGRFDRPILKDPTTVENAEYLVLESTYGDRLHDTTDPKQKILSVLRRAIEQRSCVLVPSFAIGRTQELLWYIRELTDEGLLDRIPIYVDSPMANAASLLYVEESEDLDQDMRCDLREGRSPFSSEFVRFVRDRNLSKQLNQMDGPMVIIAGSGMVTGGRILHHMKHRVADPSTIVMFTGYQADGTTGRDIQEGTRTIRLLGQDIPFNAQIERLDSLSAHADYGEVLKWLRNFKTPPRKTFLVHGEPPAQESLRQKIVDELGWDVVVPGQGETHEL